MTKNKGKLSRFFFWPFFSVLRVFAPHESRALYRDRVLAPPRCDEIAAWRLCFAKISVFKNFRGPSWRKEASKTDRERNELPTMLGYPRCEPNAAWRLCFAKISVFKHFRGPSWRTEVSKTDRECAQRTSCVQNTA